MNEMIAECQSNEVPEKLIGQLAEHTGLEPKTVRYYERAGLLHPRRIGRLRVYAKDDLERLKVIKLLRQFNVPIRTIQSLIAEDATMRIDQLSFAAKEAIAEQLSRRRTEFEALVAICSELKGNEANTKPKSPTELHADQAVSA